MHGLINRALQRFAEDVHGSEVWVDVAAEGALGLSGFEAMLSYDDGVTERVLAALAIRVGVPRGMLLEDIGTYLVSHPHTAALRRLLRFGGEGYVEFLQSLDDLPDRVRLAVPDLALPTIGLVEHAPGRFTLDVGPGLHGFGRVLVGVLRAMADDYGALALVDLLHEDGQGARLAISVAETAFAEGQRFDLAPAPGAP